jgi:hypothetical protein
MRYRYGHGPSRHIGRRLLLVFVVSLVVIAVVGGLFVWSTRRPRTTASGNASLVAQPASNTAFQMIHEPDYSFQLPSDWKETGSQDTTLVHSVSWQATLKGADNRYLTIYTDPVPTTLPLNRELPVTAHGASLSYGEISTNCEGFTADGTRDAAQADQLRPAPSVWLGVHFICNLPQFIDNQVGTGTVGSGVNSVTLTGPTSGTHNYFFLYIDRNIEPDYTILYGIIQSFRAT